MASANAGLLVAAWAAWGGQAASAPRPEPATPPTESSTAGDSEGPVATLPPAAFKAHPVQVYSGPLAKPDVAGGDAEVKLYRTRLRRAAAAGVTFGGRYGVMLSGCGTECLFGFVIDETNGHIRALPVSGERYRLLQLAFRPDSRWMRAIWRGGSLDEPETCVLRDFVVDAGRFRKVKEAVLPGPCPRLDFETGEAAR